MSDDSSGGSEFFFFVYFEYWLYYWLWHKWKLQSDSLLTLMWVSDLQIAKYICEEFQFIIADIFFLGHFLAKISKPWNTYFYIKAVYR